MSASIIPTMKYRDAPSAIDWLCRAFGFEKHLVVEGENNSIAHAQLTYGNSMIMLGSASDTVSSIETGFCGSIGTLYRHHGSI